MKLVLVLVLAGAPPACTTASGARAPEEKGAAPQPLRIEGRWVLDGEGRPVRPREFERGLQTSALLFLEGELWSIGDQRAEWPGRLLRIDLHTARLAGAPVPILAIEPPAGDQLLSEYRSIRNTDFEGLAADPRDPARVYGVTEDKRQWVVRVRLSRASPPQADIEQITLLEFPQGTAPYGEDLNYRLEGIALSDDGKTMFLAWERAADGLPRIFSVPAEEVRGSGRAVRAREVPLDFASVKPRAEKPKALLNLNDIVFLSRGERPFLLALARDQERLLLCALDSGKVERVVDLDLRAPGGGTIFWVSPEGLAIDRAGNRLWIINDPDSIRGNYRAAGAAAAEGNFQAMVPLLFEIKLSTIENLSH